MIGGRDSGNNSTLMHKISIQEQSLSVQVNLNVRLAASRVLERSIEIATGPTPPGTGVMADTTLIASS